MPTIRSGLSASAAIAVTESDEVLVASTASEPQTASSSANSSRFRSRRSGAASITRVQPASPSSSRRRGDVLAGALDSLRKGVPVGVVHDHLDAGPGRELRDP